MCQRNITFNCIEKHCRISIFMTREWYLDRKHVPRIRVQIRMLDIYGRICASIRIERTLETEYISQSFLYAGRRQRRFAVIWIKISQFDLSPSLFLSFFLFLFLLFKPSQRDKFLSATPTKSGARLWQRARGRGQGKLALFDAEKDGEKDKAPGNGRGDTRRERDAAATNGGCSVQVSAESEIDCAPPCIIAVIICYPSQASGV